MVSTRRVAMLLVALVGASFILMACSSSGAADPAKLEGDWALESFGAPNGTTPADPNVPTDLAMQAGKANGFGGVNSYNTEYEASDDGSISFGPIASTKMAGPETAMKQETEFFAALEKAKRFEFNEGKLVLGDSGNNTLVVLQPK